MITVGRVLTGIDPDLISTPNFVGSPPIYYVCSNGHVSIGPGGAFYITKDYGRLEATVRH